MQTGNIARVALDVALSNLDRFFDYAVPDQMQADAVVGARVRVRFAGRLCNGFIVERPTNSDAPARLSPLSKVVSPEPVLKTSLVPLIRAVADHYAGTFADVARLAVAPRHAATEAAPSAIWPAPKTDTMPTGGLDEVAAGRSWLDGVARGRPLRGFWAVPPCFTGNWGTGIVQAVVACLRAGRGAIVVVPDATTMALAHEVLEGVLGRGCVARLHAQMGLAQRYRNYLAVARGQALVVVGTRSAVFAPMDNLGLIVMLDDGSDLFSEPRAPYPNARTVAAMRAVQDKSALLLASSARSCEAQLWVERGWLGVIEQAPLQRRHSAPAVRCGGDPKHDPTARTHLPLDVSQAIRFGLTAGPVLVQVPRAGYLVALACQRCRTPVTCPSCNGPVGANKTDPGERLLTCRWCGRIIPAWQCAVCGGKTLRAPGVGASRTAEELGRAFPGFRIIDSSSDHVVERVGANPALVIATPGAEPRPEVGYTAAVLLDADQMLSRPDPRAAEEAVRRWFNVFTLVRPGDQGGTVYIAADPGTPAVQALLRVDPGGFAARELKERREAGLPPATAFIEASGDPAVLAGFLASLPADTPGDVFGPVDVQPDGNGPRQRVLWRCELGSATALTKVIKSAMAGRMAAKAPGTLRVQVDPVLRN